MLNNPGWKDISHSKPCKLVSGEGERPEYVLPTVRDYVLSAYELTIPQLEHTMRVITHTLEIATAQQVVSRFITEMKLELETYAIVYGLRTGKSVRGRTITEDDLVEHIKEFSK